MSEEKPTIVDTERAKHTERLIHDDFRKAYNRPFYTWNDKTAIKEHVADYLRELVRLSNAPKTDETEYRINIVRELLKDCK